MTQDGLDDHLHAWSERPASQSGHIMVCLACAREWRQQTVSRHLTPARVPASKRTSGEVPQWREGLPRSVLPTDYGTLMAVLTLPEAASGLRAGAVLALTGSEPALALVRTTRIQLRLLATRGWALERAPGLFTTAPGPAALLGAPTTENGGAAAASQSTVVRISNALAGRTAIERAKGMLAQAGGLTVEQAHGRLLGYAHHTGHDLATLAHALVNGALTTTDLFEATQRG